MGAICSDVLLDKVSIEKAKACANAGGTMLRAFELQLQGQPTV